MNERQTAIVITGGVSAAIVALLAIAINLPSLLLFAGAVAVVSGILSIINVGHSREPGEPLTTWVRVEWHAQFDWPEVWKLVKHDGEVLGWVVPDDYGRGWKAHLGDQQSWAISHPPSSVDEIKALVELRTCSPASEPHTN